MAETMQGTMAAYTNRMTQLTSGKSGDFSLRRDDQIAITPTATNYTAMESGDFPVIDESGEFLEDDLEPSSELPMHRTLYDGLDCGAVVHVHSSWATTLCALGEPLSYVHYAAALAGPEVPLVEYYTYGTDVLAGAVVEEMQRAETSACLLANHGQVAVGDTLEDAFDVAEAVEFTAKIECQARMLGSPQVLSDEDIIEVTEKFNHYGQSGGENQQES